eukprot:TRINITY_DN51170_c0_g1_i1.p2 TRINITY_DN51170_c0_g1~~TRINITY_DN51170_c0_g1_i1.p2  ORF type:complete len:160 (+),score=54.11 TRINITY_DN51170_c0_g1_i1:61-540(+)
MALLRRTLAALLATVLALPLASAGTLRRGDASAGGAKGSQSWWVLDRLSSLYSKAPDPKPTEPPQPSFEAAKNEVILSAAFGRKINDLCNQAPPEDKSTCRQLAVDRLFCALMKRHAGRYEGMQGAAEEMEKCKEIDPMEEADEAAADERLQKEAKDAF